MKEGQEWTYSLPSGKGGRLNAGFFLNRKEWTDLVKSLIPEGFIGAFHIFSGDSQELDNMLDDSFPSDPDLTFLIYVDGSIGLGKIRFPEQFPNLRMIPEDISLYCQHIVRLAGSRIEEFYLSNDPDTPEILTLEFEYGANWPGSFNIQVSSLERVELPYLDESFFLHDLWLTLPSQGWIPILADCFMKKSGIETLKVCPRMR